jgi:hypothetical protein
MADDGQKQDGERLKIVEMERILGYSRMIIGAMDSLRMPRNEGMIVALKLTALMLELDPERVKGLAYEEAKLHIEFFLTDLRGERR